MVCYVCYSHELRWSVIGVYRLMYKCFMYGFLRRSSVCLFFLFITGFCCFFFFFFFSSRRRHTRSLRDWSSDVCSSDLGGLARAVSALAPEPERLLILLDGPAQRVRRRLPTQTLAFVESLPGGALIIFRSEERRVGKECRFRWLGEDVIRKHECSVDDID